MRIHRARNEFWFARPISFDIASDVAEIIGQVRDRGDDAVLDYTERFDHAELAPGELRVDPNELEAAVGVLEPDVLRGLRTAIANVKAVASAQVRDEPVTVELPAPARGLATA